MAGYVETHDIVRRGAVDLTRKWNAGNDHGSFSAGSNLQASADLPKAFTHAKYADSYFFGVSEQTLDSCRHASPKIYDLQDDEIGAFLQAYDGRGATRMTNDIRKSFLHYPKKVRLDFPRQASKIWSHIKLNL